MASRSLQYLDYNTVVSHHSAVNGDLGVKIQQLFLIFSLTTYAETWMSDFKKRSIYVNNLGVKTDENIKANDEFIKKKQGPNGISM